MLGLRIMATSQDLFQDISIEIAKNNFNFGGYTAFRNLNAENCRERTGTTKQHHRYIYTRHQLGFWAILLHTTNKRIQNKVNKILGMPSISGVMSLVIHILCNYMRVVTHLLHHIFSVSSNNSLSLQGILGEKLQGALTPHDNLREDRSPSTIFSLKITHHP